MATALASLRALPSVTLSAHPTPVDRLDRFRQALAHMLGRPCPTLLIKRDDLLTFAMGGNKVRKLQTVLAEAKKAGADTLITCGGVQSNHCRVTAAAGAVLGMKVMLVLNGTRPNSLTGNALLQDLFGADLHYVGSREDRDRRMTELAEECRNRGGTPFVIPLGASTPVGAAGFARAIEELLVAGHRPHTILHASSSAGTQAGMIAGCALFGLPTQVVGVSADESAARLASNVRSLLERMADLIGGSRATVGADRPVTVDDRHIGEGYGRPTTESRQAMTLLAQHEGIVLDPVYTAKAMAGLIQQIKEDAFSPNDTVLFWHTGGQAGLFA